MRVAHLLPNMVIGGRERMVASLCAQSIKSGFEPVLICYDPPDLKAAQISCNAQMIQLDRKKKGFISELSAALTSFDVVHAQGHIPAYYLEQTRFSGVKVATMHIGMEDSWRWLLPVRRGLRAMDHLTAVSRPMAKVYSGLAGRPVDMIANGISLDAFRGNNARPVAANEPFRFVMLSRLHKVKRHVDAIAAIDCLVAAGKDVELIIAGEGPEAVYLQKCAATRPYLRLVGAVSNVAPFLGAHHGLILCSEHEGMPVTLMEAMAVGLPIIACDVGSVADIVGTSALLVLPKRKDQLTMAMMQLVSDKDLWQRLAAQAAIQAPKFDAANMSKRYTELYKQLLMR
jgi:glycosyltransferase involved in cell wall biosynthesis